MKIFKLLIFLFINSVCLGQVNPLQINFGQMSYDLLEEPLTQESLETILNTFSSFGDKEVVLQEVISSFLIEPNTFEADSLMRSWLNDYSREDSLELIKIPGIDPDFRARAYNLVWMSYFINAEIKGIAVIESMISVHKAKNENFPNYPNTDSYDGILAAIYNYYAFSKWSLEYPNEFKYFLDLVEKMTIDKFGRYSEENVLKYVDLVVKNVRDKRLIYELYLPVSMEMCFRILEADNTDAPSFTKKCTKENIDQYLKEAYKLVYGETLSSDELLVLKNYVEENDLYSPQVIYLALILSKYE